MFKKRGIAIGGIALFVCLCFVFIYGVNSKFAYKEMAPSSLKNDTFSVTHV